MTKSTPPTQQGKPSMAISVIMLFLPGWEDEDAVELNPDEALRLLTDLADAVGYQIAKV